MVQNFIEILMDLLQNVTIVRGQGKMVSLNRKLFENHPMKLASTQIAGIPLTTYMDTQAENAVKSLNFLYSIVKSDVDNLVFLDTTYGKKGYSNGVNTIAYSLKENGDVEETIVHSITIQEPNA